MNPITFVSTVLLLVTQSAVGGTLRVPQQYQKIQWAVDAAGNSDTVLVSRGVYDENVVINNLDDLNLVGKGRVTINPGGSGIALRVSNSDRVRVRNIRMRNAGAEGILVSNSPDLSISRCETRNTGAEGIRILTSPRVLISNCRILDASDAGIHAGSDDALLVDNRIDGVDPGYGIIVDASMVTVADNRVEGSADSGILLAGDSGDEAAGNVVSGNDVRRCLHGILTGNYSNHTAVIDNHVTRVGNTGISLFGSFDFVHGNRINRAGFTGIHTGDDGIITSNRIIKPLGLMGAGIWLFDDARTTVARNSVSDARGYGFRISGGSVNNQICDNTAKKSRLYDLLYEDNPADNTLIGNRFKTVGP